MSVSQATNAAMPARSMRELLFPVTWLLLWPVRAYLRHFPWPRGKGFLVRHVLFPFFPPAPATMDIPVPGGAQVGVLYRDALGWDSLLNGPFEWHELSWIRDQLQPGDQVIDVGANLGLYTVMLAHAVGAGGQVLAIEPVPRTRAFAEANIRRNRLANVKMMACAVGDRTGRATLQLATDTGYSSLVAVAEGKANGESVEVAITKLDLLWADQGSPDVKFVKIDVEGAEAQVIRGAHELLTKCHPMLLLEAKSPAEIKALEDLLRPYGYELTQPMGFMSHNFLARVA